MFYVNSIQLNLRIRIFYGLVGAAILVAFFYLYFVGSAIYSAGSRNETFQKTSDLSRGLLTLEQEYLNKTGDINMLLAYNRGFTDVKKVGFITGETRLLSYQNDTNIRMFTNDANIIRITEN